MTLLYLIVPLISVCIAQVSKFFIKSNHLSFKAKNLLAYSGMPSSHAAITVSLATIIGFGEGFYSPIFALAILITFITLRDALGIRQYIGKQGEVLNELVEDLNEDRYLDDAYPQLVERVGHTKKQIIIGSLIGIIVAVIGHYFF